LREFGITLNESKYFPAFRNAINEGAGNYYDLPVGTALVATWDQWKAGNSRAQQNAISKVEKEIALLLGFNNLQINADQSGKTLNVNIDGRPQKLHEVGAGVAQLIIVLAAALVYRPPYILIDEPELSLHPALQLSFLATLGSYARYGLFFSTHSISLARSSAQRIYAVRKIGNGLSEIHPYGDNTINFGGWLGELSYSSRVDLGCEGLLLVEGPTEILCFQEFLRKLKKDHKYVLIQLGGSSLIRGGVTPHLSELSRIIDPSKIRVFIDSEKESADAPLAPDRVAFFTDCKGIGISVHVSERRATENYFEIKGIQKFLGEEYKPLEHYQKLKSSSKPWHKSDNWRIARETEFADIKDTDLGQFLSSL
jgi:energy-coupling factor transporter ATP-binding protein EcfA2